MFEVKLTLVEGSVIRTITIAYFEPGSSGLNAARNAAVKFAKQVDRGFAVTVTNVENEDNAEMAFGLVYHRDAEF